MAKFLYIKILYICACFQTQVIGKNISYCLKTDKNGLPQLSYDIGNKILFEDKDQIKIELSNDTITLNKSFYLNTPYRKKIAIYDDGKVFFALCDKHVNRDYIFKELINYACKKIETRISHLETLKHSYKKLIAA